MIETSEALASKFLIRDLLAVDGLARYQKNIDEPAALKGAPGRATDMIIEGEDFLVPTYPLETVAQADEIFLSLLDDAVPQSKHNAAWHNIIHARTIQEGAEKVLAKVRNKFPTLENSKLKILCHSSAVISPNWEDFIVERDERVPEHVAYCHPGHFPPGVFTVRQAGEFRGQQYDERYGMAIGVPSLLFKITTKSVN